MKKIISVLLSALMLFTATTAVPFVSSAVEGGEYGNYCYYIKKDGTVQIDNCWDLSKNIVIPSKINGKKVTSIGAETFEKLPMETVKIPNTITEIGEDAFFWCKNLKSVEIPDSVTKLGSAFARCYSLEKVKLPKNIKILASLIFLDCCSLKEIIIPKSVKKINYGAFIRCTSLKKVTLSEGLKEIGDEAFYNCNSLKSIKIPKSVTKIGDDRTFGYYDGYNSKGDYYIKKCKNVTIKGYTNTAAEKYAKKNKIKFSAVILKTPKAKITAGKKKITVKYTKVSGASGFQVQYTKGKKTVKKTYKTAKSATKAITKLKKGKYKVKVRAYYLNNKKQKAYSPWTKTKTVTVK